MPQALCHRKRRLSAGKEEGEAVEKGEKRPSRKGVPGEKKSPGRTDRLAKALRENLKKRKAQARTRAKTQ